MTTTARRAPDNRLSLAASAIWRYRNQDPDPMGDPSGDCGDLIAAGERRHLLRMVAAAGYVTPGEYNASLRRALGAAPDGLGAMSHRVYQLLSELEVEDACPQCGAALDVTHPATRQYGGGTDTVYHCAACGYSDVCV